MKERAFRDLPPWVRSKHALAAARMGDMIIVLLDPTFRERTWGQFRNLRAYSESGEEIWVAEHPTNTSADSFYKVRSWDPLVVLSAASFDCTIDPLTGRLLSATFTK